MNIGIAEIATAAASAVALAGAKFGLDSARSGIQAAADSANPAQTFKERIQRTRDSLAQGIARYFDSLASHEESLKNFLENFGDLSQF